MNRSDLVKEISTREGLPVVLVDQMLTSMMEVITDSLLKDDPVSIRTFGKFEPRYRAAVTRLNPATGEPIDVPPTTSVGFVPSRNLKKRLNP